MTEKFDFYSVQKPTNWGDYTLTTIETICKTEEEAKKYIEECPYYALAYRKKWVIVGGRFGEDLEMYFD